MAQVIPQETFRAQVVSIEPEWKESKFPGRAPYYLKRHVYVKAVNGSVPDDHLAITEHEEVEIGAGAVYDFTCKMSTGSKGKVFYDIVKARVVSGEPQYPTIPDMPGRNGTGHTGGDGDRSRSIVGQVALKAVVELLGGGDDSAWRRAKLAFGITAGQGAKGTIEMFNRMCELVETRTFEHKAD